MITRQTVFVLGAGASKPYGFLTGSELRASVLRRMNWSQGEGQWRNHLSELDFDQKEVDGFNRALRQSGRSSVDLFVEHRPEYVELGKAAIALALIPCEIPDSVFPTPDDEVPHFSSDNWYQYIFEKMSAPFDQFGKNKVSFVTFNYDRSLEHFFRTALKYSDAGKSLADADAVLENIPIVHVHGHLGALKDGRHFGPELSTQDVRIAMDDIVIMPYANPDSEAFQEARQELDAAEQIFFLGFGYHESNMNRLQMLDYVGKIKGGTSLGLGRTECRDISAQWQVPMMFAEPPWPENMKTLKFLKEAVSFR